MKLKSPHTVRLMHFVPLENLDISEDTKIDMILNTLYLANKRLTMEQIKALMNKYLGCDMEISELKNLINKLLKEKYIHKEENNGLEILHLDYSIHQKINKIKAETDDFERKVISNWASKISPTHNLTPEQSLEIQTKLVEFLSRLFITHGVSSISLLENYNNEKINSINEIIHDITFSSEELANIARHLFNIFLSSDDADIRQYLRIILNKAFRYLTTVCDPDVIENLKKFINGKIIYLDSSTIYRLVQLQGHRRFEIVKEVVKLCKEFGLIIKVSAKTLEELHRRIKYDARVLRQYPTPTNLSAVGHNYYTEENFISTYWELSKQDHHLTINDFIDKYKNIDILLVNEDIVVETEFPDLDVTFDEKVTETISRINTNEVNKSLSAAEHDAYLLNLADKCRTGRVVNRFIDNPCWILTTDSFYLEFQSSDHYFKDKPPLAIMPTQLLHILRYIRPTDNKFVEMFLDVFSRKDISLNNNLDNESIQKILSRISHYKGFTPELADLVLSDQLFKTKYRQTQQEAAKNDLIDETVIKKAKKIVENSQEIQRQLQVYKNTIDEQGKTIKEISSGIKQTSASNEGLANENYSLKSELDKLKGFKDKTITVIKISFLLIYSGLYSYLLFLHINKASNIFLQTVIVSALPISLTVLFRLLFGSNKTTKYVSHSIYILSVISIVYSFLQ